MLFFGVGVVVKHSYVCPFPLLHLFYLWGLWCVQNEVRELFEHLVESSGHVTLRQHLSRQIGQQAGGQFSVARFAFEGQGHSHGGELVLVWAQVESLQQHLTGLRGEFKKKHHQIWSCD